MSDRFAAIHASIIANTAKAQSTNVLAADWQPVRADSIQRIAIAATAARKVQLVPSSGTAFYLNGGSALVANTVHVEDIPLDPDRTWNIQTDDVSGITVTYLRVIELSMVA